MTSEVLYPVSEACENLLSSLCCEEDSKRRDNIILEHLKLFSEKHIDIGDFKSNLEWFNVSEPLSLRKQLRGKVVVLDFFTYCCVNCLHILPLLKLLERDHSVEDGLVVVGVHSAKFDNEKDSANIAAAIQRYDITHPVVNDADGSMWHALGIPCWPTLLILGASGEALFLVAGEGQKSEVVQFVRCALRYYNTTGGLLRHALPLSPAHHVAPGPLLFPGKVACASLSLNNNGDERLAVSDTGHHRVIVLTSSGHVEYVAGEGGAGLRNGDLTEAQFSSPQGVVFLSPDVVCVADTNNHAVREINLKTRQVATLFQQEGCSPWDLCVVSSGNVLLIAMAGVHQIWALFLAAVTWWKGKQYEAGACVCIAGTGREENRNNLYPHAAGFAQPSGLTAALDQQAVYIADSESSTVRKLSLVDGKVSAVVGGDRSPLNLFAFGDVDGKQFEVRLQHPLGVAWCPHDHSLYVADSYNHKLKVVDTRTNTCQTLLGQDAQLNEPGGLCISPNGTRLYVADTNNHCIKVVYLQQQSSVHKLAVLLDELMTNKPFAGTVLPSEVTVNSAGGEINLVMLVTLADRVKLTAGAPQKWSVELPGPSWSASCVTGDFASDVLLRVLVPRRAEASQETFSVVFRLYICVDDSVCSLRSFCFLCTVLHGSQAPASVRHEVSHVITPCRSSQVDDEIRL